MVHAFVMTPHLQEAEYHRVAEEVGTAPVDGVILHLCVRGPEGVQYVEIWDSEEACARSTAQYIVPAVERALGSVPDEPPRIEPFDVVSLVGPFGPTESRKIAWAGADAWNAHDLDAFLALYSEDCALVTPAGDGKGHQAVRDFWDETMTAFPDSRLTDVRITSAGDEVFEEGVVVGTNTGPSRAPDGSPIPPTGRSVSLPYAAFHRVADGKVVASRFYWDQLGMIGQMGLM
ncbi:ester cyclase [Actinomycetospora termitidis]|uniref:Nuclear transport factor 2 family protein n=1 Tax=Actinomycetospora termitidis TaxID=3053470 RepID=A0ABT7MJ12_9PSEU|nr:nuclear transport factor 2 family protein [Actinomycetospora sp. Odt1-22]MDL5159972.1 nuclear transport factor 2 family protein [Actinomycetospora sp. Odt1-22]